MDVKDISLDEYFGSNELSKSVFKAKYFLENDKSVTDVFKRVAEGLSQYEKEPDEWAQVWTQEMLDGWYRPGGSILAGVGNSAKVSLANCTTIGLSEDTIDSISEAQRKMMKCAAARQGLGVDVSNIRPKGSKVNNAAKKSGGVVPWMDYLQSIANYVGQEGRMPALLLSIKINHPDVIEFIKCKQDLSKITNANISVQITDDFMRAVKEDLDWIMTFETPHEKIEKTINARELMNLIAKLACETAEPGVQYIDVARKGTLSHQIYEKTGDKRFKVISTNACLPADATVLTPNGISDIGKIQEGDTIWTGNTWTKVLKKWSNGIKPVYKYSTDSGEFIGTEDHKILCKGERIEVGKAEKIDMSLGSKKGRIENDEYDKQAIVDGALIAMGQPETHLILFTNPKSRDNFDFMYRSEFSDYITYEATVGYKARGVYVKGTVPYSEMTEPGMRYVPDRYFYGDEKTVCSFLRGVFSMKGQVIKYNPDGDRYSIYMIHPSLKFLRQIQIMLSSLGIASVVKGIKRKYNHVRIPKGQFGKRKPLMFSPQLFINNDFITFSDKIGFIQPHKCEKLYERVVIQYQKEQRRKKYNSEIKRETLGRSMAKRTWEIRDTEYIGEEEVFDITVEDESHAFWCNGLLVSNCSEKFLAPQNICMLGSLNMNKFSTDPDIYKQQLEDIVPSFVRLMDNAIEYEIQKNLSPIEDQKWIVEKMREIGLGITNVHAWLLKQGFAYDSDEAANVLENFFKHYMTTAYKASMDLAEEKGPAGVYAMYPEELKNNEILKNSIAFNNVAKVLPDYKRPLRNLAIGSVAPTGTLSMTFSEPTLSSGIEPAIGAYYWRKTRALSGSSNAYKYFFILPEAVKQFITDLPEFKKLSKEDQEFILNCPESQEDQEGSFGTKVVNIIKPFLNRVGFKPAHEIDVFQKIKMMSRLYQWLDSACSVTYNLPKGTTPETIADIYIKAWEQGVRAVSVYVDGSREGILVFEPPVSQEDQKGKNIFCEERPEEISFTCAPKRGKKMPCEIHRCKVKGKDWLILVGMLNGYPYEIFAGEYNKDEMYVPNSTSEGVIIKNGKGAYSLLINIKGAEVEYKDIARTFMNERYRSMTRMISLALRHGVRPVYIIDQIKKADEDITEFSSVVTRILNKYIKALDYTYLSKSTGFKCEFCGSEEAIFSGGCKICANCKKGSKCD